MRCCDSTIPFQELSGVARGGSAAVCDPNPPRPLARSPSYGTGRYGFGVFEAQDSVLRDRCSVGTRHGFSSITSLSI